MSNLILDGKVMEENLEKALFGKLDTVVKYRKIVGTMIRGNSYILVMFIMTDELRYASKYNFLIHNIADMRQILTNLCKYSMIYIIYMLRRRLYE